ncbi:MAG: GspE/PulE family protein [Candidatus Cloacimonetes bacterium]|nr:GspE/PulE family protein [Candidatus Cloacimonadota bacterium]
MKESLVIGKLLLLKNIITQDILNSAIRKVNADNETRNLESVLVDDFKIDHDRIYTEVAKLYAIPRIEIRPEDLSEADVKEITDLLDLLPKDVRSQAVEKRIIPYKIKKRRNDSLIILASVPTDSFTKTIAEFTKAKRYEIVYCPSVQIEKLINLTQQDGNEYLKILDKAEEEIDINAIEETDKQDDQALIDQEINKGALVYLFEAALIESVRTKVSDIHIIPYDNTSVDIRFRIDGKLQLWKRKENVNPQAFLAVVKDRSNNVDRFKIDEAQDGFIQRDIDGYTIRFRVSILPIVAKQHDRHYESIVIRILDDRNVITNIDDLGFLPQARKDFEKAITAPQGLIIVTGPTGSGKSTTLIGALYHVITPEKNVLTVEDPVEYVITGARQIKISYKNDFENAIRAILRHDPDIVLVGEIRDKATAETAVKLANTGHLTLSTLHTNDAPSAVSRLFKMGVEPFLLAYSVNLILAQRLVRKLCPKCKKPLTRDKAYMVTEYGISEELVEKGTIYEPVGCENCRNTGYRGRLGIHETLYFTEEIRESILNAGKDVNEKEILMLAKKHGMLTLRESGIELVRRGLTSIQEVISTTTG